MKKPLRWLLNFVIVAGCVLMLWPLGQTAYGTWSQRTLHEQWQKEAAQSKTAVAPIQAKSQKPKAKIADWPATRLVVPEIGLDTVVLQGWDDPTLRRAPGHAPKTALPGGANCVIAGHRNVYGSWFRRLNELLPDSVIQLVTPQATYTYRVALSYSVSDTDTTIFQPLPDANGRPQLTLMTCTLPHSSTRMITVAMLEDPNR